MATENYINPQRIPIFMTTYKLPFLTDLIKKYKPSCNYCQETINKIHSDNLNSYDTIIVIKPDYNCSGIITHYHIIDFKNPLQLKEKIDFMIYCYQEAIKDRKENDL